MSARCWTCRFFKHDPEGTSIGCCEFRDGRPQVNERSEGCKFHRARTMAPWDKLNQIYQVLNMRGGAE
jgi:hypothetical protein